jgi:hypothetical protein
MKLKVKIEVEDLHSDFKVFSDFIIDSSEFNSFDVIMDSEFSNLKMNCLSYVYKNHPSIWYNTPLKIEDLSLIQLNPIYRIKL